MQGRPVGQYIPPSELQQSKAKQEKQKGGELSAPDTQVIASGRLVSASEAGTAQPYTGCRLVHMHQDMFAASDTMHKQQMMISMSAQLCTGRFMVQGILGVWLTGGLGTHRCIAWECGSIM